VDKLRAHAEKEGVREATRVEECSRKSCWHCLKSQIPNPKSKIQHRASWLVVGVNGSGKTTSIAKLTNYYKAQNKKVILAAADTFRAAAIESIENLGQRVGRETLVAHQPDAEVRRVAVRRCGKRAHARRRGLSHRGYRRTLCNQIQLDERVWERIAARVPARRTIRPRRTKRFLCWMR